MKKIHVGTLPPPLGGISVYLYRLSKLHKDEEFYNSRGMRKSGLFQLLWRRKKHFVWHEFNVSAWKYAYFFSFFTGNKYSIVLHGQSLEAYYDASSRIEKRILRLVLNRAQFIQSVNLQIKNFLLEKLRLSPHKILVQSAFLVPPQEDEKRILCTYTDEMISFINERQPLLVANAYKLVFWNGDDLYGLDMCVELVSQLKKEYPNIGLLFALANDENQCYLQKIKDKIKTMNIEENFHFMTGQKELWPVFKKVDLMVRPTCTDGDAVSIREALHFRLPVVASDICQRPKGTIAFKNRDPLDFIEHVKDVLKHEIGNF